MKRVPAVLIAAAVLGAAEPVAMTPKEIASHLAILKQSRNPDQLQRAALSLAQAKVPTVADALLPLLCSEELLYRLDSMFTYQTDRQKQNQYPRVLPLNSWRHLARPMVRACCW